MVAITDPFCLPSNRSQPLLPLRAFAGTFANPFFGEAKISLGDNNALTLSYASMRLSCCFAFHYRVWDISCAYAVCCFLRSAPLIFSPRSASLNETCKAMGARLLGMFPAWDGAAEGVDALPGNCELTQFLMDAEVPSENISHEHRTTSFPWGTVLPNAYMSLLVRFLV
jgi:hypothetical protein